MDRFKKENFFDLSNCDFSDLFKGNGNVWDVLGKINSYLKELFASGKIKGNYAKDVYVGKNVHIDRSANILGPAIIGEDSYIGDNVLIRGNFIIGRNVRLGHAVEIKNSIILSKATVAHFNYIGDSIIGNEVNLSAGAVVANYRLDKKPVVVNFNGEKIKTELLKFGAVIGDSSNIGVNSALNPGTILGKRTVVYPLTSVTGVHENDEVIKSKKA